MAAATGLVRLGVVEPKTAPHQILRVVQGKAREEWVLVAGHNHGNPHQIAGKL